VCLVSRVPLGRLISRIALRSLISRVNQLAPLLAGNPATKTALAPGQNRALPWAGSVAGAQCLAKHLQTSQNAARIGCNTPSNSGKNGSAGLKMGKSSACKHQAGGRGRQAMALRCVNAVEQTVQRSLLIATQNAIKRAAFAISLSASKWRAWALGPLLVETSRQGVTPERGARNQTSILESYNGHRTDRTSR
jgi:hypothetical protein